MRIIKQIPLTLTIIFLAIPLFAAEFTADSHVVGNGRTMESRFSYAGDKWRIDENLGEEKRITIFRKDKKSLYILWPDKKRYVIQPLPEKEFKIIATRKPGAEIERTNLGQENVSSYLTIKDRVKYNVQGKTMTSIEWYSKDLGVVIKSRAEDNSWSTELTNIKKVKLDKKLFDIPHDYKQLSRGDIFKKNP
jgi:hypothetical protein